ncbi:MAG: dihydrofolate reductase [Gammaproteobacteria bacterium]|nr:dihydrofolate reductase [Gammaproteobacteria bacterium]
MRISLIAAVASNGVIGADNDMPWHLPGDLPRFRRLTMGKPVLMGRRTYHAIGKPLDGRTNIVLTRNHALKLDGCLIVHSLAAGIAAAGDVEELMIIGGGQCYREAMPLAHRMYLTLIDRAFAGDTTFPSYSNEQWSEIDRQPQEADGLRYDYVTLDRVAPVR